MNPAPFSFRKCTTYILWALAATNYGTADSEGMYGGPPNMKTPSAMDLLTFTMALQKEYSDLVELSSGSDKQFVSRIVLVCANIWVSLFLYVRDSVNYA